MNNFITGATGFIGKNMLISLLALTGPDDRLFLLLRKHRQFDDKRIASRPTHES